MNGNFKKIDRNILLHDMSKAINKKRQIEFEKGQEVKLNKELAKCTFSPKTNPLNPEVFGLNHITEDSYETSKEYSEKMKKNRQRLISNELELLHPVQRKRNITIPVGDKRKNKSLMSLCEYYSNNACYLKKGMTFEEAKKKLHEILLK